MKKKSMLKINKEILKSVLDRKEQQNIQGGYLFSLINGCSHSLCFSNRCGFGITVNSYNCCSPK